MQERLRLIRYPRRIECFDVSNLAGREPVATSVVFTDGTKIPAAIGTTTSALPMHPMTTPPCTRCCRGGLKRAQKENDLPRSTARRRRQGTSEHRPQGVKRKKYYFRRRDRRRKRKGAARPRHDPRTRLSPQRQRFHPIEKKFAHSLPFTTNPEMKHTAQRSPSIENTEKNA